MRLVLTLVFVFISLPAFAETLTGKVVSIADGDTFTLLTEKYEQKKVRLGEIDTPERGQPYADKAKDLLSKLIFGQEVTVEQTDVDRYGRIVGTVYVLEGSGEQLNVNAAMVSSGAAWVYRQYAKTPALFKLEKDAQDEEKGLWALPASHRIPPWEWRHKPQTEINKPSTNLVSPGSNVLPAKTTAGFRCKGKRYCKEMSSCAEARFYLTECGLSRLDGDGDGNPCENLCK